MLLRPPRSTRTDSRCPVPSIFRSGAVEHLGSGADLDEDVSRRPYGRRRLVALARAVACAPSMILLDEPAAGLDVDERGELRGIIRSLAADKGMGVLLVEQDVELVAAVCAPPVVIDLGRAIAAGPPAAVSPSRAVAAASLAPEHPTG